MASRTETVRTQIQRLVRAVPFQAFTITLENRQRIAVMQPENIAFDPTTNGHEGSSAFVVLTQSDHMYSTFDAVTSITLTDKGDAG